MGMRSMCLYQFPLFTLAALPAERLKFAFHISFIRAIRFVSIYVIIGGFVCTKTADMHAICTKYAHKGFKCDLVVVEMGLPLKLRFCHLLNISDYITSSSKWPSHFQLNSQNVHICANIQTYRKRFTKMFRYIESICSN